MPCTSSKPQGDGRSDEVGNHRDRQSDEVGLRTERNSEATKRQHKASKVKASVKAMQQAIVAAGKARARSKKPDGQVGLPASHDVLVDDKASIGTNQARQQRGGVRQHGGEELLDLGRVAVEVHLVLLVALGCQHCFAPNDHQLRGDCLLCKSCDDLPASKRAR